jgi:hypothetical protein
LTLEFYLPALIELLFGDVAALVDWSRPVAFLDSELQAIVPDSEAGDLRADKLVQVTRRDGTDALLFIHFEIQAQRDPALPRRMFRYHYRIYDRFGQHPISLVVLADDEPGWRPGPYVGEVGPVRLSLEYAACKLRDVDLGPRLASGNPVARIVQAHRLAQRTRGDEAGRWEAKLAFLRELRGAGLGWEDSVRVMRVVHGLLALPRELEVAFRREVKKQEEAMHETMRSPYETVVWEEGREEGLQLGRQEGRQEGWRDGRQEGLEEGRCAAAREMLLGILTARFGPCDDATVQAIQALSDGSELMRLAQGAIHFGSLADFRHEVGTRRDVPTA